ncbi:MAG: SMP-30/gluconolactonase/LRE family protein [Caldilineaceae bacterium SB0665_bin_25]|nr:SMP-30/gluconolactonase/LRE family protein [Caldilineaceae bacterium SB0665_bin_25]
MSISVDLLIDAHALVGEGPIWDADENVLWWVDIMSSKLYAYDPATEANREWDVGQHVGTVVQRASGGLMLALKDGFAAFDPASGAVEMLVDPESHLPDNRFNDGKCDPAGRFWAGTMAYDDQSDQGSVYRMDTDHSVHKMIEDIGISNGIIWSLDAKTMYYTDSLDFAIRAYDYDAGTGDIDNERIAIDIPEEMGFADGFTIDEEGMLWVAHYGASRVRRWNPDTAAVLAEVVLPTSAITACAFGGPNLDQLYITSASFRMSDAEKAEQPHAGGLFVAGPGVRGVASDKFGG